MKNLLRARTSIAAIRLTSLFVLASGAQAATTWITVGEDAYAVLQQSVPAARTLASVQVGVNLPAARGSTRLVAGSETVHAVAIDDTALNGLSLTLHEELHRCAGFVQHASQAQALAALQQLRMPLPQTLAPSYAIDNQALVQTLLPQLQASNILSNIERLAVFQNRLYQSTSGVAASDYLYNLWKTMGQTRRDIRVRQITHPNWMQKSVQLDIMGSGPNNGELIVLGAHLDSKGCCDMETARAPGADDDASGVATLTEILRVLVDSHYTPSRSLRLYAYAAEEFGLLGSQDIVQRLMPQERLRVVGVMQLDMTAYQGDATDLWIFTDYTNAAQNQFLADLAAAYLPALTVGYDRCGYGCSDHASWSVMGYPVSLPFESSFGRHNAALHTPLDTTASFGGQADHALKFGQLALAYLLELVTDTTPSSRAAAAPASSGVPAVSAATQAATTAARR